MSIAAIPTVYAGVQFRSRLEARWAAFFDLLRWRWEYEPIDLDGYIPDFVLSRSGKQPALVEVKPVIQGVPTGRTVPVPGFGRLFAGSEAIADWTPAIEKIKRSGWDGQWQLHGARCGWVYGDAIGAREWQYWLEADSPRVVDAWRTAGNSVQWKSARGTNR